MAWIEQRHRTYVPYTRLEGRKVAGPRFSTRDEAEMLLRLADLAGWEGACTYVAQAPVEESEPVPELRRIRRGTSHDIGPSSESSLRTSGALHG